ncbi:MAG: phosphate ABC transporter permease subunit PstC [Elusimicrobiota bacterium]
MIESLLREEIKKTERKEKIIEFLIRVLSFSSIIFLSGVFYTLIYESIPVFKEISIKEMIFGKEWYPTCEPASFGMFPLIWGSIFVTILSVIIAILISLPTAIYINEIAPKKIKRFLKPLIEILAAIPSVIYGLWGATFLAPLISKIFNLSFGFNVLTASIVLAIMVIPIMTTLFEDAFNFVPVSFKEASYAVGANKWETIIHIIIPAASSGIINAIILSIGRVIGETMVVLMVAGGSAIIEFSIFEPVRPVTAAIASEMGEASYGSLHYHALFAAGFFLLIITSVLNIIAQVFTKKFQIQLGRSR